MFGHPNDRLGTIVRDGKEVGNTMQCVHCGCHWEMIVGSRRVRGWCHMCKGATCGDAQCDPCLPLEAKIEFVEAQGNANGKQLERLLGKYPDLPFFPL